MATALADRPADVKDVTVQLRHYLVKGYIVPKARREDDGRGTHLFKGDQVVVAAVLRRMAEIGLSGAAVYEAAARALTAWHLTEEEFVATGRRGYPFSPAGWVLTTALGGDLDFSFELTVARHRQSGHVLHTGRVRHVKMGEGSNFAPMEGYDRRSVFATDLKPILEKLLEGRG
jgi:hypothetical protein